MCSSITGFMKAKNRSDHRHDNNDKAEDDSHEDSQTPQCHLQSKKRQDDSKTVKEMVERVGRVSTDVTSDHRNDNNDQVEDNVSHERRTAGVPHAVKAKQDDSLTQGSGQPVCQ